MGGTGPEALLKKTLIPRRRKAGSDVLWVDAPTPSITQATPSPSVRSLAIDTT